MGGRPTVNESNRTLQLMQGSAKRSADVSANELSELSILAEQHTDVAEPVETVDVSEETVEAVDVTETELSDEIETHDALEPVISATESVDEKRIKAPRNVLMTDAEYAMDQYMMGKVSLKDLIDTAGSLDRIATVAQLEKFLKNSFMISMKADEINVPVATVKKQAEELLAALKKTESVDVGEAKAGAEDVIDQLRTIVKRHQHDKVKMPKGGAVVVDAFSASAAIKVFDALSDKNQTMVLDKISAEGKAGFEFFMDAVWKMLK